MEKELKELREEVEKIKERNGSVEEDKKWETSKTRNVFIAVSTYIVILTFFFMIDESQPFIKAIIPTLGYLLSSLSYDQIRKRWIKK